MPKIITWKKDDIINTINQKVLLSGEKESMTVEEFQSKWIGKHDTPPTTDENGNAVQVDALYTDNSGNMHRWTGTEWKKIVNDEDVEIKEPLKDVAIYCYPDNYTITISDKETTITNGSDELILTVNDVNTSNSNLYSVDSTPDTFYPYKWRYTVDNGWSDQLDTWVDPSLFDESN